MPYLDETQLYDDIDLAKPWDDPVNRVFHDRMPEIFRCPNDSYSSSNTAYLAVVGEETMWNGNRKTCYDDIQDGSANTIALIESTRYQQNWMNPHDISMSVVGLDRENSLIPSSNHPGGTLVALVDGSTRFLSTPIDSKTLRALLTINGGEEVFPDDLY